MAQTDRVGTSTPFDAMRGPSWITALEQLCRDHLKETRVVIEIGSFAGESTEVFARMAARVYAIDPWNESYSRGIMEGCADPEWRNYLESHPIASMKSIEARFDRRISELGNVRKIKSSSTEAIDSFADGFADLIYIDSIHTYTVVRETVEAWRRKIRSGGIMAGHDYCKTTWPGVVKAVDELLGGPEKVYEDTSWIVALE